MTIKQENILQSTMSRDVMPWSGKHLQRPIQADSALHTNRHRKLTFHKWRRCLMRYSHYLHLKASLITYKTKGAYFWSQRWCCTYFTTNTPQIHWKETIFTLVDECNTRGNVSTTHMHKTQLTDLYFTWIKLRRHIILLLNYFLNFVTGTNFCW
jgi:hypothetical protein